MNPIIWGRNVKIAREEHEMKKMFFIISLILMISGNIYAWDASANRDQFTDSEWREHEARTKRYYEARHPEPSFEYNNSYHYSPSYHHDPYYRHEESYHHDYNDEDYWRDSIKRDRDDYDEDRQEQRYRDKWGDIDD